MFFIKVVDGGPIGGLFDRLALGYLLPAGVSFPWVLSSELLAEYGFAPAQATPHPLVGLLEAIAPDRYELIDGEYHQVWIVPDAGLLEAAQAVALAELDALAERKRRAAVRDYSPAEVAGWSSKCSEAQAYQASGSSDDAPHLVSEAQARRTLLSELVDKILEKADALAKLESGISGSCRRKQDAVRACTTVEEVRMLCSRFDLEWPL